MNHSLKKLRIFAASPSDVTNERAKLETVVDSLKPMADYLGLTLEVVDWRSVVPDAGRTQQVILDQLKPTSWDIFIGILWHRFGTPPGATDKTGKEYLSGTEEEFKTAYELWKQHGKPRIVFYRCTRALPFDVDPDQLKNVRAFFKLIEDVKGDYSALYQAFDTTESFEKLLLNNLQKLLIEYGEQLKTPITSEVAQLIAPNIPNRISIPRRAEFFGRVKEMDVITRALSPIDRTWGILVDGIGGIGKTALAIEAAYRALHAGLFDAIVFVTAKQNALMPNGIREQTPVAQTLDEFLNETARVLWQPGIPKLTGNEKKRALLDVLRKMRALLIYDNLETLSKEEQEAVSDFLRELPQGCKAIVTSRRRGGEGAVWLRVEKLDWEAARSIIENEIGRDSRLASKLHGLESRWNELYEETNGSPLALVHILGLMRLRSVLTFDGSLALLRGMSRSDDLVKFVYQEARKELTVHDMAALGALSFFVPSAKFEAWMEVAGLSRTLLEKTIDRLSALSLVDVLVGEERYALHPLTRTFVRDEILGDVDTTRKVGIHFAQYWVSYTERYGGDSVDSHKTYNYLDVEWENLNQTASWLMESVTPSAHTNLDKTLSNLLLNLAMNLRQYLWYGGRWDEKIKLSSTAYKVARQLKNWHYAGWCAFDVAEIYCHRLRIEEAQTWIDLASEAWKTQGDKRNEGFAIQMQGKLYQQKKAYENSRQCYLQALDIWQAFGNERDVSYALTELGRLSFQLKEFVAATDYYQRALKIDIEIADEGGLAADYCDFGELSYELGNLDDAKNYFGQAHKLAGSVGRVQDYAHSLYGLSRVENLNGNKDMALPLAQEALRIYEKLHHSDLLEVRKLVEDLQKR